MKFARKRMRKTGFSNQAWTKFTIYKWRLSIVWLALKLFQIKSFNFVSYNFFFLQIWSNVCLRYFYLRGHLDFARASKRGRHQSQPVERIHGTKFIKKLR